MSPHNPLNRLRRLDRSSPKFHDQVSNILSGEEYKQWVPNIQGDDLVGLVDYLDKVRLPRLASLLPAQATVTGSRCSRPFQFRFPEVSARTQKDMRLQERYCQHPYTLSSQDLASVVGLLPRGVLAMCIEGTLSGSRVCVKRVRVYSNDSPTPAKATKVRCIVAFPLR
jgi:hypothetical protein